MQTPHAPPDPQHPSPREPVRSLLLYACANRKYEDFAPLYAASGLWTCPGAAVEIGLESAERFRAENGEAVAVLERHFPGRVAWSTVPWTRDGKRIKPHVVRFINQPTLHASHVYITDIDLILLDQGIVEAHLAFMARMGLPYSNSIRPGTDRMTGLHFTRWEAMYPLPDLADLDLLRRNDESVLHEICVRKGLPLHDQWWRPVPGIHPSPNRSPNGSVNAQGLKRPGWGIGGYGRPYQAFKESALFAELMPHLKGPAAEAVQALEVLASQPRFMGRDD